MKKVRLIDGEVEWKNVDRYYAVQGLDCPLRDIPLLFIINGTGETYIGYYGWHGDVESMGFISDGEFFPFEDVEKFVYLSRESIAKKSRN